MVTSQVITNFFLDLHRKKTEQIQRYSNELNLKKESEYQKGCRKIHDVAKYVLSDVSDVYEWSNLQYRLFKNILPTTFAVLFGKVYYSNKKSSLDDLLGPQHNKYNLSFTGCRRDGKTSVAAAVAAGVASFSPMSFTIPLIGPGEGNGMTYLETISIFLNLPNIQELYPHIRFKQSQKRIILYNQLTGKIVIMKPVANTNCQVRGRSFIWNLVDEFRFIEADKFQKFHIARATEVAASFVMISTANHKIPYYKNFNESDEAFENIVEARICPKCQLAMDQQLEGYRDVRAVQLRCQEEAHVEPNGATWIDNKKITDVWGRKYLGEANLAEELYGQEMVDERIQYSPVLLNRLMECRAEPYDFYDELHIQIDSCDHGPSDYAYAIHHYHLNYHYLLSLNAFKFPSSENTHKAFSARIKESFAMMGDRFDPLRTRIYVWIERPGSIARLFKNEFSLNQYPFFRVMQGLKGKDPEENYGINKDEPLTDCYNTTFKLLLNNNRYKVSKAFFTVNPIGAEAMLAKWREELGHYAKLPNGKLSGKSGGQQDDLTIVTIMEGELVNRAYTIGDVDGINFNDQLIGNSI